MMSMPGLIATDKNFQLFAGAFHLVAWLVLMPFLAAALVRHSRRMHETMFGHAPWQEAFFSFGKIFFATLSFVGALYGAAMLSIFFLAQSGLIKSPWE